MTKLPLHSASHERRAARERGGCNEQMSREAVTLEEAQLLIHKLQAFRKQALEELEKKEEALNRQNSLLSALLDNLPIGVFMVETPSGKPLIANKSASTLLGRGILPDASRHNLSEVYKAFKAGSRSPYPTDEMPIILGMSGTSSHVEDMVVERPDGTKTHLEIFGSPVTDSQGTVWASLVSFSDISVRKQAESVLHARLRISEYALGHSLYQLLKKCLEEAEALTNSRSGFIYFVDADQVTLTLRAWSNNALTTAGTPADIGRPFPLDSAGEWADCIRERTALIHNNYSRRKEGASAHAAFQRDLVVPIFRNDLVVAVIGVGNRKTDYSVQEITILQDLADLAWDIITRKQAEDTLYSTEKKFSRLFETMTDAYCCVDMEGRIIESNALFQKLTGYSQEELASLTYIELTPEKWHEYENEIVTDQILVNGYSDVYQKEYRTKDGTIIDVELKTFLLKDDAGKPIGMWAIIRDISDRKRAELKLRESREKFKAYIDNSFDVIFSLNGDGVFRFVSQAWERHFGYSFKDVIGKKFSDFVHPEDVAPCAEYIRHVLSGGQIRSGPSFRVKQSSGSWRSFVANCSRYQDSNNEWQCIGVAHDITDQMETEKQLHQAKEFAETGNRAKSDFLATVSHEIRTPLGTLLGNIEMLEGTPLSSLQQEYLKDSKFASHMLLQVINDVLDISKIEAGKLELINEDFSLASMCRQLIRMFSSTARQKGLDLTVTFAGDIPEYIRTDQQRLRQIIGNLINNAIKFTQHGTVSLEITCDQEPSPAGPGTTVLRLVVRDTGIGIPVQMQDRIFDSFTQVDSFSTRSRSGTGLGLSICSRLLAMMGGGITVSSEPGVGSVFTVVLPVAVVTDTQHEHAPLHAHSPAQQITIRKILLADDDERGRGVAKKLLQRRGYEVTAVENGTELLEALQKEAFDILLTDISMPDMDGTQVAQIIRSGSQSGIDRDIPIIAMTAHAFSDDRDRFLAAGINGYVAKPINLEDLFRQIETLCAGAR